MPWRPTGRGLGAGTALTASFFYNMQSGRPYSTTFSNDMNGDIADNDIVFVPASASDVVVHERNVGRAECLHRGGRAA